MNYRGGRAAKGSGLVHRPGDSDKTLKRTDPNHAASTAERMEMKISSKDFRVKEGDEVELEKWPAKVEPVYKSKDHYQKLLEEHVAQLSSLQQLHYASDRWIPQRHGPSLRASSSPCAVNGTSVRPVCWPESDHSVSPCRTR